MVHAGPPVHGAQQGDDVVGHRPAVALGNAMEARFHLPPRDRVQGPRQPVAEAVAHLALVERLGGPLAVGVHRQVLLERLPEGCQETRTFAQLGDTNFCALMRFEGRANTVFSGGGSFGSGLVSDRGSARRRERSDRSYAAPRSETSPRVHPPHAPPSARRSSVAGTRRRASSSFSR